MAKIKFSELNNTTKGKMAELTVRDCYRANQHYVWHLESGYNGTGHEYYHLNKVLPQEEHSGLGRTFDVLVIPKNDVDENKEELEACSKLASDIAYYRRSVASYSFELDHPEKCVLNEQTTKLFQKELQNAKSQLSLAEKQHETLWKDLSGRLHRVLIDVKLQTGQKTSWGPREENKERREEAIKFATDHGFKTLQLDLLVPDFEITIDSSELNPST